MVGCLVEVACGVMLSNLVNHCLCRSHIGIEWPGPRFEAEIVLLDVLLENKEEGKLNRGQSLVLGKDSLVSLGFRW